MLVLDVRSCESSSRPASCRTTRRSLTRPGLAARRRSTCVPSFLASSLLRSSLPSPSSPSRRSTRSSCARTAKRSSRAATTTEPRARTCSILPLPPPSSLILPSRQSTRRTRNVYSSHPSRSASTRERAALLWPLDHLGPPAAPCCDSQRRDERHLRVLGPDKARPERVDRLVDGRAVPSVGELAVPLDEERLGAERGVIDDEPAEAPDRREKVGRRVVGRDEDGRVGREVRELRGDGGAVGREGRDAVVPARAPSLRASRGSASVADSYRERERNERGRTTKSPRRMWTVRRSRGRSTTPSVLRAARRATSQIAG